VPTPSASAEAEPLRGADEEPLVTHRRRHAARNFGSG